MNANESDLQPNADINCAVYSMGVVNDLHWADYIPEE